MNEKPFKKTEWIEQGHKWATTLPSAVRKAAAAELAIPQHVETSILPAWSMSILDLLKYPLPIQIATISTSTVVEFFSKTSPGPITQDALLRFRHLPIPDTKLVRKLGAELRQAWLDGFMSVRYTHLTGTVTSHFPLWLVTYWNQVLDIKLNVRQPWAKSQGWVEQQMKLNKKRADNRSLAEQANVLLGAMPWSLTKPSDSEPFHSLWRFLGPHWLAGSQLNDMLELLRFKISSTPALVKEVRVRTVDFTNSILKAYDERETVDYETAHHLEWLRTLAEDLVGSKAALLTVAHLGPVTAEQHWTAVVVDVMQGVVSYGDGFNAPVPVKLIAAYRWWISHHAVTDLKSGKLPIAAQGDAFSCGMLAVNALEHFTDPAVPLVDGKEWAAARIGAFNAVVERAMEKVRTELQRERSRN